MRAVSFEVSKGKRKVARERGSALRGRSSFFVRASVPSEISQFLPAPGDALGRQACRVDFAFLQFCGRLRVRSADSAPEIGDHHGNFFRTRDRASGFVLGIIAGRPRMHHGLSRHG